MAVLIFAVFFLTLSAVSASGASSGAGKTAILLASFGTTVVPGVESIVNISEQVKKAFPQTEVRITFTSNMVRSVWKKRRAEPQQWLDQGVPPEVLNVKNVIQTMGDLQEDGYRNVIVQPTHMFFMEQSHDLNSYVHGLASIRTVKDRWKPFDNIAVGRPALGMPGERYSYHDDVERVVRTLAGDAEAARNDNAILLYMGHGNEHWSTGIYSETENKMREMYPDVETFIGVVEGWPTLDDVMVRLRQAKTRKVLLLPFMITAGDHAKNDMAGPDQDSWLSVLTAEGFEVQPLFRGLGSNDSFAALFVENIRDAAKEKNIVLQ